MAVINPVGPASAALATLNALTGQGTNANANAAAAEAAGEAQAQGFLARMRGGQNADQIQAGADIQRMMNEVNREMRDLDLRQQQEGAGGGIDAQLRRAELQRDLDNLQAAAEIREMMEGVNREMANVPGAGGEGFEDVIQKGMIQGTFSAAAASQFIGGAAGESAAEGLQRQARDLLERIAKAVEQQQPGALMG